MVSPPWSCMIPSAREPPTPTHNHTHPPTLVSHMLLGGSCEQCGRCVCVMQVLLCVYLHPMCQWWTWSSRLRRRLSQRRSMRPSGSTPEQRARYPSPPTPFSLFSPLSNLILARSVCHSASLPGADCTLLLSHSSWTIMQQPCSCVCGQMQCLGAP